jgi:hypothetical protein
MARTQAEVKAPVMRTDDAGRMDFEAMGFDLLTHDDEGKVLTVARGGKDYPGARIIRVADLDKAREYVLDEALLAALDGQSIRVGQQDVCRNYLVDCAERRAKPMEAVLEERLWKRLIGERMKGGGGKPKVIVKIMLPSGELYTGAATVEDLRSAIVADLMDNLEFEPQVAVSRAAKMEAEGKIAKMLEAK